jgi:23S rRNA pseudouridine955/2504/2580 synthase
VIRSFAPVLTSERADQKRARHGHRSREVMRHGRELDARVTPRPPDSHSFEDNSLAIDTGVAVHGGSGVSFGVIEQLRMARLTRIFWNWFTAWIGKPAVSC